MRILFNSHYQVFNSTCIIILGMHRSGTSALTGSLQESGLYLGKVSKHNPYNLKGNYENTAIRCLNNNLFINNGGEWYNPPSNISWGEKEIYKRDKIIFKFALKSRLWGFKDPRTLFTLPFWLNGLNNYKLIGIFRHPISVAKSLHLRNNLTIQQGLELWGKYNEKLIEYVKKYNIPVIHFNADPEKFSESLIRIKKLLEFQKGNNSKSSFFNETLIHHDNHILNYTLPQNIGRIYQELLSIYQVQSLISYAY